ncbi:MFS transporter [Nocardioides sp. SYSU D00038]|uniref:MFS transporter n=1 Tax=Nocardioides sp. SYSU D00038 TaxID=2812554 RepID=UPI0027DC5B10|nr:MFS transporter [Nocardioides sp. SYSU D00038]
MRRGWFVLLGIVLLAFNLRPAAVSVGPVLEEVRAGLSMSAPAAGLLTSLPVLAFAGFGALTPELARRVGLHRTALLAAVVLTGGLAARTVVDAEPLFLLLSLLALAGMAAANVLLPSLVKLHFPDRVGTLTAIYTTSLAIGLTGAVVLTVPISDALGGWRAGLGAWALTAAVAIVPWVALGRRDRSLEVAPRSIGFLDVARTPIGRAMALFFGLQSLQAYAVFGWFATLWRDAGWSATQAGLLVGVVTATSIPLSLWAPGAAARRESQRLIVGGLVACYPVGYLLMALAPHTLAVPAALVVGVGTCTFPVVLVLIGLRSRTPEGTAALSGFAQSTGYLLAALGPWGMGVLHELGGGWTLPLAALGALSLPLLAVGLHVARPATLEDQLATRTPTTA